MHADQSTAGLLLSLASIAPRPLARRARAVAARLSHGASTRALEHRAADLLADLLTAADADQSGYVEDGLIDPDFDA